MKQFLYLILAIIIAGCKTAGSVSSDKESIKNAIDRQMSDYPESTLRDVYKNFFQDAFGPGHLMSDAKDAEARMADYLRSECEEAKADVDHSPYYLRTGWHGRFYRVNLSVINDGKVPFDTFLYAFMQSARDFTLPKVKDWSKEWSEIEKVFNVCGYQVPGYKEDSHAIKQLLGQGRYAIHHSERYNKAYHPHYRLIEKNIFEQQILPLLK